MTDYMLRTDANEKKTTIVRLGDTPQTVGMIYTDFLLQPSSRDISLEDVIGQKRKVIARIRLFTEEDILISVESMGIIKKRLGAINGTKQYIERGKLVPYRRLSREALRSTYPGGEEIGITHGYELDPSSQYTRIICCSRESNLAGIIQTRNQGASFLPAIPLVLLDRIESQDYVFEFIRP